nr:hypothetical protein [Candidatus Rhodoblastus alkanivorans]
MQNGVETIGFSARAKLDPIDHRADQVHGFRAVRSLKDRLQLFDLAPVKLWQVRVRQDCQFRLRRLGDIDLEVPAFVLEGFQPLLHRWLVKAILDRPHHPGNLAIDFREFARSLGVVRLAFAAQGAEFVLHRLDELGDQIRREQPVLQSFEDPGLDLPPTDCSGIVAGSFLLAGGAAVAVLGNDRVAAAATAAAHQPRQQKAGAVKFIQTIARVGALQGRAHGLLAGLGRLPKRFIDDSPMRNGLDLPRFLRVGAGDPSPGPRILHIGAAVPFEHTAIKRIIEKACSSIGLAAKRCIGPGAAARTRDRFLVEPFRDRLGAGAGRELTKYPPDRLRFPEINLAAAAPVVGGGDAISVGQSARALALEDPSQLPTPGFFREILERHLGHHAHDGDMDLGDLAD